VDAVSMTGECGEAARRKAHKGLTEHTPCGGRREGNRRTYQECAGRADAAKAEGERVAAVRSVIPIPFVEPRSLTLYRRKGE